MKPLFADPQVQADFEKQGFVVLPALEAPQVQELRDYFQTLDVTDPMGYGFYVSMDSQDAEGVQAVMEKLKSIAFPKLQHHFQDVQVFTSSYVVKEPHPQGVVPAHQDWTFVEDEGEYCSATCWIPLQDVTMDNGALSVIHGSTKMLPGYRASPSPQVKSALHEHLFSIFPYLDVVELKAGQAFIFDNRTFHASPPNTTDEARLAIGLGVTQKDAQLVHYMLKPNGKADTLLKYRITPEFFHYYNNTRLSKMYEAGETIEGFELLGEVSYKELQIDGETLMEQIKAAGNQFNVPLVEKLAKLFNYNMDGTKKEDTEETPAETPQEENQVERQASEAQVQQTSPAPEPFATQAQADPVSVDEEANYSPEYIAWKNRTFWQTYTPLNIYREIRNRIFGKPKAK